MDPATIATGVLTILTPYLVKGAKEFTKVVGEVACEKATALFQDLKKRWSGDADASTTLEQFERKPERHKAAVEDILKEKLTADPQMAREYSQKLEEIGPFVEIVQKIETAGNVTGLESKELNKGRVSVTQEIKNAESVTGVKLDRLG